MKFTLGILSLALLSSTFFVSCNNEDEATPQQENNNLSNKTSTYEAKLQVNNKTYYYNNNSFDVFVEDIYAYNFEMSNLDYIIEENSEKKYKIINSLNENDYIEITENSDGSISLNAIFKDNILKITNLEFKENTNYQARGVGGRLIYMLVKTVVPVVIEGIFKEKTPNTLEDCTKALEKIKCSGNQNPYMDYNAGNRWSEPSCKVGCK